MSRSGSTTRNASAVTRAARARATVVVRRLISKTPPAALRESPVILFDRFAVALGGRALVARAQVGAPELFAQAAAQLKLKLTQRVYDLRLERGGRLRAALHAPVRDAPQLFDGAAEFPAPRRAGPTAAQPLGLAQTLAQLRP
jgi:hypothetical protein